MSVSFMGLGERVATFHGDEVGANVPVKLSASKTVAAAASGDRFIGVSSTSRSGFVAVQVAGYVVLPYTGTAPAVGFAKLAAGANGAVTANANGTEYLVLDVNTTSKTVGFIL